MEEAVSAARWVVGKALGPVTDDLLKAWAVSAGLGPNVNVLKMELLYAQGMLDSAQGRDVLNSALKKLLHKLRQLAYDADDVLDELDYFRIQDALDGTYHAADVHPGGCVHGLVLNARHTARAVARVHRLDNLRRLQISSCPAIRSLPKDGLPSSLQELKISYCPAIRSLPKDGLPSSLRVLDVQSGNSEELRRRCRKLSGTIPIIIT